MSRTLLNKLNNLPYDEEHLEIVSWYLKHNKFHIPDGLTKDQTRKLIRNYKDFVLDGDKIIYKPLLLEAITTNKKEEILKEMYNSNLGLDAGIKSFYAKITNKYIGIKRADVAEFLKKQTPYQLTKNVRRVINKPIIADYPNHRWEIDLLDVSIYSGHNKKREYILSGVDCFSRKKLAIGIINKKPTTIIKGLEEIVRKQTDGTYPVILQADNGGEFVNELMTKWAKNKNVKLVNTRSHTPQSNGMVENWNKKLRQLMRDSFIRHSTEKRHLLIGLIF